MNEAVRALTACGLSLHGFGVKTQGLAQVASLLTSSDSMAWSVAARWLQAPGLPECVGGKHKNCANCLPYALHWRSELLAKLPDSWSGSDSVCGECGNEQSGLWLPCEACKSIRTIPISTARSMFGDRWRDNFKTPLSILV